MGLPERDEASDGAERMADVLERIRAELEEISARIDRNQAMIARTTWSVGVADADYVRAMQDADLSAQRIAGVAGFLRALGDAAHPHWRVDTSLATGALTLAGLIRSIGFAGAEIEAEDAGDAGDVDLF